MTNQERLLKKFLRLIGTAGLLAIGGHALFVDERNPSVVRDGRASE